MRLDIRALTITAAIVWGGALFLVGLVNLVAAGYGTALLETMGSIYPGYAGPDGFGSVVVLTVIGLVDGAIAGFFVAWIYNLLVQRSEPRPTP